MDEPSQQHDTARLVAQLAAGDEGAFAEVYDRFGPRLFRTALHVVGRRQDAEDAVQEVFIALVRSRHRLFGVHDLPAYLFASLRRAAARVAQRRAAEALPIGAALEAMVPPSADADPRGEALRRAMAALSDEQREVIAMKIDGELTFAEIGRVLEISPNTAASRYRYALERLRGWLKD